MPYSRRLGCMTQSEGSTYQLYRDFRILQPLIFGNEYFRLYYPMRCYLLSRSGLFVIAADQ